MGIIGIVSICDIIRNASVTGIVSIVGSDDICSIVNVASIASIACSVFSVSVYCFDSIVINLVLLVLLV